MKTKMLEIRDEGTCIAALAIKMEPANEIETCFLSREGYPPSDDGIVLMMLGNQKATSDPYEWGLRTMAIAHNWLLGQNWDEIDEGRVIDVRVINGEREYAVGPEIWMPTYANGAPKFSKDGTLLDENGNRSVFDDVDQ